MGERLIFTEREIEVLRLALVSLIAKQHLQPGLRREADALYHKVTEALFKAQKPNKSKD